MAGDWIKIRCDLRKTTQVKGIASRLGMTAREVVGRLVDVWGLGDAHAISRPSPARTCPGDNGTNVPDVEGFLSHYTLSDVDDEAGHSGFGLAMQYEQWLDVYPDGIGFPEWDKHHSKSAKERACEQKKKRNQRRLSLNIRDKSPVVNGTETGTREEKRREEKSNKDNTPPKAPKGAAVEIPAALDCDSFRQAWALWLVHRAEIKKRFGPTAQAKALAHLATLGVDRAVKAIDHSIANGWQGIYEESRDRQRRLMPTGPGQVSPSENIPEIGGF